MRVLLAGWFSFEQMGASAGDLLVRDLVCVWLVQAGVLYDVALAPPFSGGVDWQTVNPDRYSHVVFVCGPFGNGWPITEFLPRFARSRKIGINLSMLESLETWNPFDLLLERDSSVISRPDITFIAPCTPVPVVGVVLIDSQPEYKGVDFHQIANDAIKRLIASRELSAVSIDTRLDVNRTGLRSPAEIETLIARMDVVLTTRLHGLVLALKHGIPALAIDPVAGGAKIKKQCETIGWPIVFTADALADEELHEAFSYCLTEDARRRARGIGDSARESLKNVCADFLREFNSAGTGRGG
jgi:hypothetical protein